MVLKTASSDASFIGFDCDICLDIPREPVVTLCGHLYCLCCISTWLRQGFSVCPVCKSAVTIGSVIRIHGKGLDGGVEPRICMQFAASKMDAARGGHIPVPIDTPSIARPSVWHTSFGSSHPMLGQNIPEMMARRRAVTHFLISLGLILILMIICL